ncbi:MAG: HDOD domain-containing protein [Planctomycetales bacterium]|jgi:HD-like signal output (HDOD) protein|nr:HDOD domain-containing protein [Planctomycetales bacterium]MBN8624059.1 HDOD domain-containing protein [Planctomycetota bacterium]
MTAPVQPLDLTKLLAGHQLPALPQSAIAVMEVSKNPQNGPAEYGAAIEADPGLTAQVLKFVNSSYFGFGREVRSVKHAVGLVGGRTIKNFVLWTAVFSVMPNPKSGPFDLKSLRQDSLRRGLLARALGKRLCAKDSEELFAAALLQDMGIPILAKVLPREYGALMEARKQRGFPLSRLERAAFGWDHADAAACLAESWNLPHQLGEMIRRHTHIDAVFADSPLPVGEAIVATTTLLPSVLDQTWSEVGRFTEFFARLAGGADDLCVEEILTEVDTAFAEFGPTLQLEIPATRLAERFAAQAEPTAA